MKNATTPEQDKVAYCIEVLKTIIDEIVEKVSDDDQREPSMELQIISRKLDELIVECMKTT